MTDSRAQAEEPSGEYILKSLVLYNFAKFVEWPPLSIPDAQTPLDICILGEQSVKAATPTIGHKSIQRHPIAVRKVTASEPLAGCHILFVEGSNVKTLRAIQQSLGNGPTLTVCDLNNCAEQGFMIGLRMETGKVRLAANLQAIQRSKLKVSSQLIKLATPVESSQ
ncbi:MAG: YfiR family protein [Nitrospira sp.]|nr:YfiR family protein [Nitrospira sp.]